MSFTGGPPPGIPSYNAGQQAAQFAAQQANQQVLRTQQTMLAQQQAALGFGRRRTPARRGAGRLLRRLVAFIVVLALMAAAIAFALNAAGVKVGNFVHSATHGLSQPSHSSSGSLTPSGQ
jgi:hypothetical protein